jgi:hypothetical protein
VSLTLSRRHLLALSPFSLLAADTISPAYPSQSQEAAAEVVGVSHANLKRVKELVSAQPALAKASYDWGFGDWETALGAASHVGNREIALYLLENGAPATIFSATMLGQLEVVKAFVAAQPGIHLVPGPHGIPLLAHAFAGGPPAAAVKEFLQTLPPVPAPPVIPDAQKTHFSGVYTFGPGPTEKITISTNKALFQFTRQGRPARNLSLATGNWVSGNEFHPAGAPAVRIRFAETSAEFTLQIFDPELVLTARRPKP